MKPIHPYEKALAEYRREVVEIFSRADGVKECKDWMPHWGAATMPPLLKECFDLRRAKRDALERRFPAIAARPYGKDFVNAILDAELLRPIGWVAETALAIAGDLVRHKTSTFLGIELEDAMYGVTEELCDRLEALIAVAVDAKSRSSRGCPASASLGGHRSSGFSKN